MLISSFTILSIFSWFSIISDMLNWTAQLINLCFSSLSKSFNALANAVLVSINVFDRFLFGLYLMFEFVLEGIILD